jgi:ABC-type antimicrobial peptide transport system permease subunit
MLRYALHSLSGNRLRSWLTMTGIVIGVAAVIVLVALGNGMKAHFNEQFSRLANQITITPTTGSAPGGGVVHNLTDRDVAALQDQSQAPDIASVSPSVSGTVTLTVAQTQERASLVGATDNYLDLVDRKIVAGTWLTPGRSASHSRQAVLGQQAVALLWGPGTNLAEIIGSPIRIDHSSFTVVGVLDSNGQNDNVVVTPFEAARTYLVGNGAGKVDQIIVKSTSVNTIDQAAAEASRVLDTRHYIKNAADRDYNVLTFTNLLTKSMQFIDFLTEFIVAVAAISLIVGGIGVANIMLVAVTERTHEIGIRKAVGATRMAIMQQFLSEAVILSGLGGLIGIGFGIGLIVVGDNLIPANTDSAFPHPILSPAAVLVAFGVSLLIGVVTGGYPAHRAGRLRPIEALRFQ